MLGEPLTYLALAIFLVILNGFFVAAEFALVKVRPSRVEELVRLKRPFSKTAMWLVDRLEGNLASCQLGITMASLALGWVGEPAFAKLIEPGLTSMGITSSTVRHTIAFIFAFTVITSLHLVIGEQAPKIFAIRRPEQMLLWCAVPMKWSYIILYPFMVVLNKSTAFVLRGVGLKSSGEHGEPHTEEEIRALLREAHIHGQVTRSEHRLINAVFEFDDMICRRIMLPRGDVDYFDINQSLEDCLAHANRTKHTRYPVCNGSLDDVIGVIHVKDLVGINTSDQLDWTSLMRPPRKVPENMPISKLLRHFQATHHLLAFVIDEYGTVVGIVTLENVLEQIIGNVADEFDSEEPNIQPDGSDQWIVMGSTPLDEVERNLGITTDVTDVDTFSGLLMHQAQRLLNAGDKIEIDGHTADVLEIRDDRAFRVRVRKGAPETAAEG